MAIMSNTPSILTMLKDMGIDINKCTYVTIHIPADDIVTIQVMYHIMNKDSDVLTEEFKKYELKEIS